MAIKSRTDIKAEFSMASLTDIIFLLLIFFMLTSSFVAPNALKLLLPKADGIVLTKQNVTVSVSEDLKYKVEGTFVTINQMESELKKYLKGEPGEAIVIAADKRIEFGDFVDVLKICKGLTDKVVIKTEKE